LGLVILRKSISIIHTKLYCVLLNQLKHFLIIILPISINTNNNIFNQRFKTRNFNNELSKFENQLIFFFFIEKASGLESAKNLI